MSDTAVGLIGCGNISATYFDLTPKFKGFRIAACADINHAAAEAAADAHGIEALPVGELLARDDIEIVVNLTIPAAHCEVACMILEAGKHAYSEKPLALTMEEGSRIRDLAEAKGLAVGCAPDTYMGGAHQLARKLADDGAVGSVTSGSCHVMNPGMEMWHPNPDFFFKRGGGPVFDLGPYYITALINLIGPVRQVTAMAGMASAERTITSQPRAGEKVEVEIPTTILAVLEFESGALVSLSASWDVWAHRHANMELYGDKGSLYVPDPNFFGGEVAAVGRDGRQSAPDDGGHPLGVPNQKHGDSMFANYRSAGLAEMADALRAGREPRCSLPLALHVLEVMEGIHSAAESGRHVRMQTTCGRPAYFGPDEARALLR